MSLTLEAKTRSLRNASQIAKVGGLLAAMFGIPLAVAAPVPFLWVLPIVLAALVLRAIILSMRFQRSKVRIDEQGLHIDGVLRTARSTITQALFVPEGTDGAIVRVESAGAQTAIVVRDEAEAKTILRELDMAVDQRAAKFNAVAPAALPAFAGMALGLALMMFGLFAKVHPLVVIGPALALLAPLLLVPASIVVGIDGVYLKSLVTKRFYAFDRIDTVTGTQRGVSLKLRDGSSVDLPLTSRLRLNAFEEQDRNALVERITRTLEHRRAGGAASPGAAVATRLERGSRPFAEWLAQLTTEESATFREMPLRLEDLRAVLEDPAGAPNQRVAAALVLAKRGGADERALIRVAAETAAAPKLRVALDTIATGESDATRLEEVLREAEAEEPNPLHRRAV